MTIDYTILDRIHARARRERAEAVYRLIVAPAVATLVRFFELPHAARSH